MKKPWEEFPQIWKTKAAFMSYLRGGIRRAIWNRSPIKHTVIHKKRKKVLNKKTGNMVWGGTCYLCGQDFVMGDLQVDHMVGEHSLQEIEDIQSFVESMTCLSEDMLGLVCEPCHRIKSYAERYGITFEDAKAEKQIINLTKKPVKEIKKILDKHKLPSNNAKVRRESLKKLVEENLI